MREMQSSNAGWAMEIHRPTLILRGALDIDVPPVNEQLIADRISNAKLVTFEGASHGLPLQEPTPARRRRDRRVPRVRVIDMDERRQVPRRVLVPFLLAMMMAACGSESAVDPQPPAVGAAFANRAVAVCQAALAQKKAQGPFPYPDFNPTQPDASKLPDIARFLTGTVETFGTWLNEMQALGQPPSGEAAWDGLLAAIKHHVRLDVEQQAAAERGDTETFTRDYNEGVETQAELLRATEAAGVPECADVDR